MGKSNKSPLGENAEPSRRDFIHIVTGSVAAFGACALAWPMIAQMGPASDKSHLRAFPVDLTKIPEGSQVKFVVGGRPIFVKHRTKSEIALAQNVDVSLLKHPETDDERLVPMPNGDLNRKFLVLVGICTHFGTVLVGEQGDANPVGRYGGWYCPSHGAQFDTSGRTRSFPAPRNMDIPSYRYVSENQIEILYNARYSPYP